MKVILLQKNRKRKTTRGYCASNSCVNCQDASANFHISNAMLNCINVTILKFLQILFIKNIFFIESNIFSLLSF